VAAVCEQEDLAAGLAKHLDRHYEQFVLAYQHRIYGFVLRLTGSRQDAEEIAQDTFIRAYRALAAYPAERIRAMRLLPWLYQIALNAVRNHLRRRSASPLPIDDPKGEGVALDFADDPQREPPAQVEQAELREELARTLAALPVHFRAAVILRHVEGYTYQQIAEILGEPVGTVKSHTHRGTLLLRDMLVTAGSEVRA
jgi:RNA polymerase sigma-70 factor (ECF subfamily)